MRFNDGEISSKNHFSIKKMAHHFYFRGQIWKNRKVSFYEKILKMFFKVGDKEFRFAHLSRNYEHKRHINF